MEDVESERSFSRKKRKLTTRQGVVIGVATVAGLGLVTKLFSFLRRDSKQPKNLSEAELETLEAVLSGDAAKSPLPPQTSTPKFANLEPDSDDEPIDHHNIKDAAVYAPTTTETDEDVVDAAKTQETPHFQHPSESENHENGDAVELDEDHAAKIIPGDDEAIEDAVHNMHHLNEDAHTKVDSEGAHTKYSLEDSEKDAEKHAIEDVEKLPAEDHVEKLHEGKQVASEEAHTMVDSEDAHTIDSEEAHTMVESEEAHSKYSEDSEKDAEKHATEDAEKHDVEKLPAEDHEEKLCEPGKHDSEDAQEVPSEEGPSNKQANGGSREHGKLVSDDEVKQQDDAENVVTEENVGSLQVEPEIIKQTGKVPMEGEGNYHKSEDSVEAHSSVEDGKDDAEKLES